VNLWKKGDYESEKIRGEKRKNISTFNAEGGKICRNISAHLEIGFKGRGRQKSPLSASIKKKGEGKKKVTEGTASGRCTAERS